MTGLVDTLRAPAAALACALVLTLILRWETARARWSPFFLIHAALAIFIPLLAGAWPEGGAWEAWARGWRPLLVHGLLLLAWEIGVCGFLYETALLRRLGRDRDPAWSPAAAQAAALAEASARFGMRPAAAGGLFAAYALAWAPLGEDLLFWGYLHATLSPAWGFWPCTVATAALFACHHAFYLGGRPAHSRGRSLAAFAATGLVSGLIMGSLFRATGSLYPVMAAHLLVNLAWVAIPSASAFAPAPGSER